MGLDRCFDQDALIYLYVHANVVYSLDKVMVLHLNQNYTFQAVALVCGNSLAISMCYLCLFATNMQTGACSNCSIDMGCIMVVWDILRVLKLRQTIKISFKLYIYKHKLVIFEEISLVLSTITKEELQSTHKEKVVLVALPTCNGCTNPLH